MTEAPSITDDEDAVEGLKRLGLSTYEAQVFVALQKLETGTASEIADVSDVPRSQVYGATEGLEDRGLIEIQQGTPTRYRPVDVDVAHDQLLASLEATGTAAFEYIEAVRGARADEGEQSEAIWTVQGRSNVAGRCVSLIGDASTSIVYAVDEPRYLEESIRGALEAATSGAIQVSVVSADDDVLDVAGNRLGEETTFRVPPAMDLEVSTGRVLLVDDATILMSLPPSDPLPHLDDETAFWSRDSGFATLLAAILREWFGEATIERFDETDRPP